jgi:RNA polymerase sigma-70 factor (sigma-E family)
VRKKHAAADGSNEADDPEDFPAFVAASSAQLYRTACLLTGGDTHLAEDLVQEALVSVCLKWGKRHDIDNPVGYAQRTLVNAFISMRRKRSNGERPDERPVADTAVGMDLDLRLTLLAALARMPELDRAVLVLRYWEDRSAEDTANMLGIGTNAVRSRAFRALGRLRELLGSDFLESAEY